MDKLCIVYLTASNKEEALTIGEKIVSSRLAACVNVIDNINSIYWWEGKLQKDGEAVLIVKTKEKHVPELERVVKEAHSYSCPAFLAIPVIYASKDYEEWINKEVKSEE